ncbi:AAA family ATPase [Pusillimonas sp. ANT_WB101]|uniref:bifunctional aminoglycoside phosphotransferase/ATP-binding protein n=1 Tax=Pusillimonas sp. ANT_WB101 TaxID=2597356 RepID=UPI001CAA878D|nr:AAA family ATPase [Pusillimonas sp. ANT_WB101]
MHDQRAVLAFLTDPSSYGDPTLRIHTKPTHISLIIFVGSRVFKVKRAVRLPYVDFSTVDRRLEACERELILNQRTAPSIYIAVRRITLEADGSLMFDGQGTLLDAVVEMVRFDEDTLFDRLATQGRLTPVALTQLARTIAHFHADADVALDHGGAARMAAVLDTNAKSLASSGLFPYETIASLTTGLWRSFDEHVALLNARARAGKVRRCHGDMHLRNICMVEGVPTLFDCIEFDETLATIDVLYDLAFLLMDLWYRQLEPEANLVFNRYLDEYDEVDGLALLPFFMSLRATIRAHVTVQQALHASGQERDGLVDEAMSYAALALRLLTPASACLVAIGGLSGSGKSSVAAAIAHKIGSAPGARILASDRIRKHCYGVIAETRLPERAYEPEVSAHVYATLAQNAQKALASNHGVVADAVFDLPVERQRIEDAATDSAVRFTGFWLQAQPDKLLSRVEKRVGDPSDATAEVVRAQLASDIGRPTWFRIDAGGDIDNTVAQITQVLGERSVTFSQHLS